MNLQGVNHGIKLLMQICITDFELLKDRGDGNVNANKISQRLRPTVFFRFRKNSVVNCAYKIYKMAEAPRNRLPPGHIEEFVREVKDDCRCLICHLPLKKPVLTRCGHRFCKECLEEHFRRCALYS